MNLNSPIAPLIKSDEDLLREFVRDVENIDFPDISVSKKLQDPAYISGVLGIKIPLNESHPYSPALQARILEEQLQLEGFFDGVKKLGGDMKNSALALRYIMQDPSRTSTYIGLVKAELEGFYEKSVEFLEELIDKIAEIPGVVGAIVDKLSQWATSLLEKVKSGLKKIPTDGWKGAMVVSGALIAIGFLWKKLKPIKGPIFDAIAAVRDGVKDFAQSVKDKISAAISQTESIEFQAPALSSVLLEDNDEQLNEFLGGLFGKKEPSKKTEKAVEKAAGGEFGVALKKGTKSPADGVLVSPEQAKAANINQKTEDEINQLKDDIKQDVKDEISTAVQDEIKERYGEEVDEIMTNLQDASEEELLDVAEKLGIKDKLQSMKDTGKKFAGIMKDQIAKWGPSIIKKLSIDALSGALTGGVGTAFKALQSAYGGAKFVMKFLGPPLQKFVKGIKNPEEEAKEAEEGIDDPTESGFKPQKEGRTVKITKRQLRGLIRESLGVYNNA